MSPSSAPDLAGMVVDGRYRLVSRIGVSQMSSVYLADDIRLRRRVVLKLFADGVASENAFGERLSSVVQSAATLRHPHIVVIHDWGIEQTVFVVSEFCQAGSLRDLLDRGHTLSPAQALQVGLAAARALAFAHERGVVHGDVRPENLLFTADARLRITDFGLARAYAEAASTEPMGAGGAGVRYAAPEQAKGLNLDGKADVYALALTLVESVTGAVPFAADTALATLMGRVDRPLDVPPVMDALAGPLQRGGEIEPNDRLDAESFATALMAVAGQLPAPSALPLFVASAHDVPPDALDDITMLVTPDALRADAPSGGTDNTGTAGPDSSIPPEPAIASTIGAHDDARGPERDGCIDDVLIGSARSVAPTSTAAAEHDEIPATEPGSADLPGERADRDDDPDEDRGRNNQRRWRTAWLVLLAVIVVGGATVGFVVWRAHRTPKIPVPTVSGLTVAQATERLQRAGFVVERRSERRDGTKAGQLLGVDPKAGTKLAEGDPVRLVISAGQTLVAVPSDLAGKSRADASHSLKKVGLLVADPTLVYSETVPSGTVIGTAPGTSARLEKGSPVTLVVSKGPEPRIIPSVAGMTPDEAVAALAKLDLQTRLVRQLDQHVDTGGLIGLDPAPGTAVARGSTVTVFESKGLLVAVPTLNGVGSVADAIAKLQAAGLVPGKVQGSGQLSGRPTAFDPPAGQLVAKGSTVDIVVQ